MLSTKLFGTRAHQAFSSLGNGGVRLSPLSSLGQVTGSTRKSLIRQENVTQGIQRTWSLLCVSVRSLGESWLGLYPGAEDMPRLGSSVFTCPAAPSWHRSYARCLALEGTRWAGGPGQQEGFPGGHTLVSC